MSTSKDVEPAPVDFGQHLGDGRHHHRPAPHHGGLLVDHEADRHGLQAKGLHRQQAPVRPDARLAAQAQQGRQRRPVDVGIENADFEPERPQAQRQVDRRRRLADAALAGSHRDDMGDIGQNRRFFPMPRLRPRRRSLRRLAVCGQRHQRLGDAGQVLQGNLRRLAQAVRRRAPRPAQSRWPPKPGRHGR
jgi:hypothetical protein